MKKAYIKNSDSMEVNGILENMEGWERHKTPLKYGDYGNQRGFKKKKINRYNYKNYNLFQTFIF